MPASHPANRTSSDLSPFLLSDGSEVTGAVSRNIIQLVFLRAGLQLCCSAALELCSQLAQMKTWLQIHKLPTRNQRPQNGSEITCHQCLTRVAFFKNSSEAENSDLETCTASNLWVHCSWERKGGYLRLLTRLSLCQERRADALLRTGLMCTWMWGQSQTRRWIPAARATFNASPLSSCSGLYNR